MCVCVCVSCMHSTLKLFYVVKRLAFCSNICSPIHKSFLRKHVNNKIFRDQTNERYMHFHTIYVPIIIIEEYVLVACVPNDLVVHT